MHLNTLFQHFVILEPKWDREYGMHRITEKSSFFYPVWLCFSRWLLGDYVKWKHTTQLSKKTLSEWRQPKEGAYFKILLRFKRCYDITPRFHCSFAQDIYINEDSNSSWHSLLPTLLHLCPTELISFCVIPLFKKMGYCCAHPQSLSPLLHNTAMSLVWHEL